jgi:mannitol 2-dehydrogenase
MNSAIKLNASTLGQLPAAVKVPVYDRSSVKTGIVHIGVGSFHRSHQAYYTDQLLKNQGSTDWRICGIALLESDRNMFNTLQNQDCLYTLIVTQPDGTLDARIIGSITECLFAPDNPGAVISKMSDPNVRIITLTITEGGYNFDSSTGEFRITEPSIQWDLKNPEAPRTVFGYLTRALHLRKLRGLKGLTLQSCDNIQENGNVLRKMLLSYVRAAQPDLAGWIEKEVSFPNSMVDRITPATSQADIRALRSVYGIDDGCPVVCEPFIQWIVEDTYSDERPNWESVGVQFVEDVRPFEKMKIRLLNAGHSLLGFSGTLLGCKTIDETIRVPLIAKLLRKFMDEEVTPLLGNIEGINIGEYKDSLFQRFGNSNIKDRLTRICGESSAKIPKFLLPTINEQLEQNGPVLCGALVVAAWCRCLELDGAPGCDYYLQDQMIDVLKEKAKASSEGDPLAFLKIETIFGDLASSPRFVDTYLPVIDSLRKDGIDKVISKITG